MKVLKLPTIVFLFLISLALYFSTAFAQGLTSGIAVSLPIDSDVGRQGSIVSYVAGDYVLSTIEQDFNMYGVIVEQPVADVTDIELADSKLVITHGEAFVLVNTSNGQIKNGDYLTSSETPGVAVKALQSGYIIGTALEDYSNENTEQTGEILAYIDVRNQYVANSIRTNIFGLLKSGSQSIGTSPLNSLRYLLAALVVIGSFVLGFASFSKSSGSAVEALGRNPLARKTIQVSVFINFLLTVFIMLLGLILAYLILII